MKKTNVLAAVFAIVLLFGSLSVSAAPKTMPDGGVFDAAFYGQTYPDVAAAFGTDETLLYRHYQTNGQAEGRRPYAAVRVMPDCGLFDAAFYAAAYPDVAAAFGTNEALLYQHYTACGKAEGRLPYAKSAAAAAPAAPAAAAGWKDAYIGYVSAKHAELRASSGVEDRYALADIDGDGIPELYSDFGAGWAGVSLSTFGKDGLASTDITWGGDLYCIPGQGACAYSVAKKGVIRDDFFRVGGGKITLVHRGLLKPVDPYVENKQFIYTLDEKTIPKEQYELLRDSVLNSGTALRFSGDEPAMKGADEIIRMIRQY